MDKAEKFTGEARRSIRVVVKAKNGNQADKETVRSASMKTEDKPVAPVKPEKPPLVEASLDQGETQLRLPEMWGDWFSHLRGAWQNGGEDEAGRTVAWSTPANPFLRPRWKKRPTRGQVTQLLLSMGGAILLGTVMGFSILNLFFSQESSRQAMTLTTNREIAARVAHGTKADVKETAAAADVRALPPLHAVMLQAGNFREKSGADQMLKEFRTAGLAAVMSERAPYRILMGLGFSRDDALKLSAIYQKRQVEVYLKEADFGGKRVSGSAAGLVSLLDRGNQLVRLLGEASVSRIRSGSSDTATPFGLTNVQMDMYRRFVTDSQALRSSLPASAREALDSMAAGLDEAVQGAKEAKAHPSQALMWQIQEGLVRYVLGYEQLAASL